MAQGSIGGTTANSVIEARIFWESVADTAACSSTVSAKLQLRRTNLYQGTPTGGIGSFFLDMDGSTQSVSGISLTVPNDGSWVTAFHATAKIPHDPDGTKTLTLKAWGSLPPSSVSWVDCQGQIALDPISRESAILAFASDDGYLTGQLQAQIQPKIQGVTHVWQLLLGETVLESGRLELGETALSLQLTQEQLEICCCACPNSDGVTLRLTLSTFLGDALLGASCEALWEGKIPFTDATAPYVTMECKPTGLEALYPEDAYIGTLYIQNHCGLEVTVSAEGHYGAAIKNICVNLDGTPLAGEGNVFRLPLLTKAGAALLTAAVTDSRGFTVQMTQSLQILPYAPPAFQLATCRRCDAEKKITDQGEFLMVGVAASYSCYQGSNGNINPCWIYLQAKPAGQEEYDPEYLICSSIGNNPEQIDFQDLACTTGEDGTQQCIRVAADQSYQIRLLLRDLLGQETSTVFLIPTAGVHCHEGPGYLALGKYANGPGVDIAADWPVRIRGDVLLGENGISLADYIRNIINGG